MPLEDLRTAVFALPADEKLRLVQDLWDSIPEDELPPLTEWQIAELERRIANARANPDSLRPWSEVYARLKARYGS